MNTPLTVRMRVDSSNGNVWVKDPFEATTWWAFTLGQSLELQRGTTWSVWAPHPSAASFGNFSAVSMER